MSLLATRETMGHSCVTRGELTAAPGAVTMRPRDGVGTFGAQPRVWPAAGTQRMRTEGGPRSDVGVDSWGPGPSPEAEE